MRLQQLLCANHQLRDKYNEKKGNVITTKSFEIAIRIVYLHKQLVGDKKERVVLRQLLRSFTAIGALVRETEQVESKADFNL